MAIAIQDVKVSSISLYPLKQEDSERVQGVYQLISTTDRILAEQSFNSYSGIKVSLSKDTKEALEGFLSLLKSDISSTLGI